MSTQQTIAELSYAGLSPEAIAEQIWKDDAPHLPHHYWVDVPQPHKQDLINRIAAVQQRLKKPARP